MTFAVHVVSPSRELLRARDVAIVRRTRCAGHNACITARMVTDRNLYCETVARAIDDYGYSELALILNVTVEELDSWATGQRRPPAHIFFRIINLTGATARQ